MTQQAGKGVPQHHLQQYALRQQPDMAGGREGFRQSTRMLLLGLDVGTHPLFIPAKGVLVRRGFMQGFGQQICPTHCE
jgi:hypothetical protein